MIDIKRSLEEIRLKLGYYNQGDFADKLGLSRTYYNGLEKGKKPLSNKTKYILINKLGISEDYLNGKTDEPFLEVESKKENSKDSKRKMFSVSTDGCYKVEEVPSFPSDYEKLNIKQKKVIDDMIAMLVNSNEKLKS